nr:MAG TPA: hypothetical protein [Caudoviricetes sp.]
MAGKVPADAALTPDALERTAAAGHALPNGLRPPEQLLFLSLRHIYRDFYANLLTRDQAHREKTEALQQYRLYAEMLDDTRRLCHTFVTITNDTEPLRRAYHLARRKGAPPEELLALACQIIRTATGDKTF